MARLVLVLVTVLSYIFFSVNSVSAKNGYGPGKQDHDFVKVRHGAHMFYWLYYTTANVEHYTERPLAIWFQGGPGASSTGYGNFEELGPLNLCGEYRNHTWVKDMNVLFIDNPVGSGFSYVEHISLLTTTNEEIATDLVKFMKKFYESHPEFETVPLHIFSQSYGGKMAAEFALKLYTATKGGELKSNLKSVALGDPWISPIDSVNAWAPLLLNRSIVDHDGFDKIMVEANKTEEYIKQNKWTKAFNQWENTHRVVSVQSKGVDFYNIEKPIREMEFRKEILKHRMQKYVSDALKIPSKVKWDSQNEFTFSALSDDFMKPVIHIVEELLNKTDLQVSVYSGQLDLICATPGTVNWIDKMKWTDKPNYVVAPRNAITVDNVLEGYYKESGNFTMFWIERAGHFVPKDNPIGMSFILKKLTKFG